MARYGLPTFPIQDGMIIGDQEPGEIEWLLKHGAIQSDIYRYLKVQKVVDGYNLLRNFDGRLDIPDEKLAESTNLEGMLAILRERKLNLDTWPLVR